MQKHSSVLFHLAFKKGLKLPGSRPDVVRTKLTPGPSPVGGATGGTESTSVLVLDEFELQAAHYNMACAYALLGNAHEVSTCLNDILWHERSVIVKNICVT